MRWGRLIGWILAALLVVAVVLLFFHFRRDPEPGADAGPSADAATGPVAAAPAASVPAAAADPGPRDLGAVLALSPDCDLGEPLASVFAALVKFDPQSWEAAAGDPVPVPGFDRPMAPTFSRMVTSLKDGGSERHVVAGLPLEGAWHGLRVTSLELDLYEMSDVASRRIRFDETPERVREALRAAGFDLPPVGEFREMEGEGMLPSIGVDRDEKGAFLACTTG